MSNLRWTRAADRAIWTATGTVIGFGLCLITTFIYFADAYL